MTPLTIKHKAWLWLLSGLLSMQAAADAQGISVGADTWCPYNCEPKTERPGVMIELAREALALSGYQLDYQALNWARAKIKVQSGELDGIVGMAYTDNTKVRYYFPQHSMGESQVCLYKGQDDDWEYHHVASLDGKVFGWINDYGFSTDALDIWVNNNKNTPKVLTVAGEQTHSRLFKLLQLKRIDTFAEDRAVINYELHRAGLQDKIVQAGCLEQSEEVYIAFSLASKQKENWAKALDAGLEKLYQSSRYLEIIQRYGLSDENWRLRDRRP